MSDVADDDKARYEAEAIAGERMTDPAQQAAERIVCRLAILPHSDAAYVERALTEMADIIRAAYAEREQAVARLVEAARDAVDIPGANLRLDKLAEALRAFEQAAGEEKP